MATGRLHSSTYISDAEQPGLLAGVAQDNAGFSTPKISTGFCFHKTVYHTVHSQKALEVEPFNNSIGILNAHIFCCFYFEYNTQLFYRDIRAWRSPSAFRLLAKFSIIVSFICHLPSAYLPVMSPSG